MFDLKKFREDFNLNQKSLAELLDVQQPFISQIENGRDPMPDYFVKVLSEKFDVSKYIKDDARSVVVNQNNADIHHGGIGQITGSVDIHSDEGKDQVIDEQKKEVNQMFKVLVDEIHGFQEIGKNHDEYVIRQDDYIKKQDEYIARIIKESYLRNERNMERIDKLVEQQNKLLEMFALQNERIQNRADKVIDILNKKF